MVSFFPLNCVLQSSRYCILKITLKKKIAKYMREREIGREKKVRENEKERSSCLLSSAITKVLFSSIVCNYSLVSFLSDAASNLFLEKWL